MTRAQNKKIISLNEPMSTSCVMIEDYKRRDSQHEPKTTTLNQNRTQQGKNDSDELKTGLNKTKMTLMTTIIKMKKLNYYKVMYPCQLDQVLNLEYPKIPYDNQYHQHPNQSTEDLEEEELHV